MDLHLKGQEKHKNPKKIGFAHFVVEIFTSRMFVGVRQNSDSTVAKLDICKGIV